MRADELTEGVHQTRKRFYSWRSIGTRLFATGVPFSPFHLGMTAVANVISRREIFKKQNRLLGS